MKQLLDQFATEYSAAEDKLTGKGDDQSSIHYPTVYLFIGDKSADAIAPMMRINERKWDNSAGVMYVHIASSCSQEEKEGSKLSRLSLSLPRDQRESKTYRQELCRHFYENERSLYELNRILRQVSLNIADYGRLYASFDRIHVSVITRVDDPLNVFIPEISLLAQSIFSQSFKSVQMDLYALIYEREQVEAFGYSSSLGVAFLRELELMQSPNYSFSAELQVTEDGISIPVTHTRAPLFDLVYILSDKDERGITSSTGMQDNYEIISHISLLKNRKPKDEAYDLNVGGYNNTSFKNNMMTESGRQGYVSAGFSRVKRPNQSIALAVLYHFFRRLNEQMKGELDWSVREKLAMFGAEPHEIETSVHIAVPEQERIHDMAGMMTHPVSFSNLKRMTLQEAEEALFGEGCRMYFQDNIVRPAEEAVKRMDIHAQIQNALTHRLAAHPEVGFYHLYAYTDEHNDANSIMKELRAMMRELSSEIEDTRLAIEELYFTRVEDFSFQRVLFRDKQSVRNFIRAFFDKVYALKWKQVRLQIELKLIQRYEVELLGFHHHFKRQVMDMKKLEDTLRETALDSIAAADDYIGQNIMEYYERVTTEVMEELQSKRGAGVFFEERYVGNVTKLLNDGVDPLLKRLIQVCRTEILTAAPFHLTFEEELLQRSNVTVEYHNRQVVSKDELFKMLYRRLEEHAGIHIRLLDYTHEHRYEEKYFFGDYTSEFVRYALEADESSRIYKLGCVHEKRSSGVEKLNMMGGFHLEDLMFYRNGKVYYEHYVQNGYVFHGMKEEELPVLR